MVRGPGNWPSDGEDADNSIDFTDEVMLDLSVVGALAPEAEISVYFTEPTEQGFVDALHRIVELEDAAGRALVCYGAPEDKGSGTSWTGMATEQSDLALAVAALRGISVVVSCGDNGAAGLPLSTRVHADYPASSPWVLGCGGTTRGSDRRRRPRDRLERRARRERRRHQRHHAAAVVAALGRRCPSRSTPGSVRASRVVACPTCRPSPTSRPASRSSTPRATP